MRDIRDNIERDILKNLEELGWKCTYCKKLMECEEQPTEEEDYVARYCWPIIQVAIRGDDEKFVRPF